MGPAERPGLLWTDRGFNTTPIWATEPSVAAIQQVCCRVLGTSSCNVEFLASGAYNKVYAVTQPGKEQLIMRVTLPVDPGKKTRGEVATLRLLKEKTEIPVPQVVAYNDSSTDEIGFEWILMSCMAGQPLRRHWRKMSMEQKVALVAQVVEYQAQLFRCKVSAEPFFRGIGTLGTNETAGDELGPLVSQLFVTGNYFDHDVFHGPFSCGHDWLRAYLDVIIRTQEDDVANARNEDDRDDANNDLQVTKQLEELLPILFSGPDGSSQHHPWEQTVIWHDDLGLRNILVDGGKITAIIDWEFVSAMPLWVAGQFPYFLTGADREEEPDRATYSAENQYDRCDGLEALDNEGKTVLYWEHRMEYEQTQLRRVYSEKMQRLWPEWTKQQEEYTKADLLTAVSLIASGWIFKGIVKWADAIKRGEKVLLTDILRPKIS
jgi:aminoglycoside phosphotransferase